MVATDRPADMARAPSLRAARPAGPPAASAASNVRVTGARRSTGPAQDPRDRVRSMRARPSASIARASAMACHSTRAAADGALPVLSTGDHAISPRPPRDGAGGARHADADAGHRRRPAHRGQHLLRPWQGAFRAGSCGPQAAQASGKREPGGDAQHEGRLAHGLRAVRAVSERFWLSQSRPPRSTPSGPVEQAGIL